MDAKEAARIVNEGTFDPSDLSIIAVLRTALKSKPGFQKELNALDIAYYRRNRADSRKGGHIEVKQSGFKAQREDTMTVTQAKKEERVVTHAARGAAPVAPVKGQTAAVVSAPVKEQAVVIQTKDIEPWKVKYRQDILQLAAKAKKPEAPVVEAIQDGGLHADLRDGTTLNFASANNVSVATEEDPKVENFDILVALAKKNNKKIKLGDDMSDEFRTALIKACAQANVQISNLSLEDLDLYLDNLPALEQKLETVEKKQEVKQETPVHTIAAIQPEVKEEAKEEPAPAPVAEEKQPEVKEEVKEQPAVIAPVVTPVVEEKQPEVKEEVKEEPAPAPVVEEKQPEVKEEVKEEPAPAPVVEEKQPEVKEEVKEEPLQASTADEHAPQAVVVDQPEAPKPDENEEDFAAEDEHKPADEGHGPAVMFVDQPEAPQPEEAPQAEEDQPEKKGFWNRVKENKVVKKVLIGAAIVGAVAFGVSRCNPKKAAPVKEDVKDRTELLATPVDSSYTEKADTIDRQLAIAPEEWNENMDISKKQFDNTYNITHKHDAEGNLWRTMWLNASVLGEKLGLSPESTMYKSLRLAAWTNKLNGRECEDHGTKWAYNYSGAFGEVVGPLMANLKCGTEMDEETLAKAGIMLSAVGKDGRLNANVLDQVVPGTSKINETDEQGWIIGKSHNAMVGIDSDCGRESEVEFVMGRPKAPVIEEVIEETPVVKDTVKLEIPAPVAPVAKLEVPEETIVVKAPEAPAPDEIRGGSTASFSARPADESSEHAKHVYEKGSDIQDGTSGQKRAYTGLIEKLYKQGEITEAQYEEAVSKAQEGKTSVITKDRGGR